MSLKQNILANYIGQFYVALIGIFLIPIYVKYMGVEAYGLVGFYAMMQAWFQLLDVGLTPTMARETARYNGNAIDAIYLRKLLRSFEGIFIIIAICGVTGMLLSSSYIASNWLKVQKLSIYEVRLVVKLIAVIIGLRWICGLYRGTVNGFERMVWLNTFNICIATLRFVFVIPFLVYFGATPTSFFFYQLLIATVEISILIIKTYRLMPKSNFDANVKWELSPLLKVLKFSSSMALASFVWIVITQTDKLILSKLLLLGDYAFFILAVLIASSIQVVNSPISNALLPRMTKLHAEGNSDGLIYVYKNASQVATVITIPLTLILAFFSKQVIWAWTGDVVISHKASNILMLYAIGNGILALTAFPYYLQFAKGELKLHLLGNGLFIAIYVPLLFLATSRLGVDGAGYAWVVANLIPYIFWLPLIHRRFLKGLHLQWLIKDTLSIIVLPIIVCYLISKHIIWPDSRLFVIGYISIIFMLTLFLAAVSSSWIRQVAYKKLNFKFSKVN